MQKSLCLGAASSKLTEAVKLGQSNKHLAPTY